MSQEAQVRNGLVIRGGNAAPLDYRSQPQLFVADVSVGVGPSPGALKVPASGLDVTFPVLVQPGLCWVQNLDANLTVEYGIRDLISGHFYPIEEWLPCEFYTKRLAQRLGSDNTDTGTGSTPGTAVMHLKVKGHLPVGQAYVDVRVDAFET